jgi:uncharacterized protein
MNSINTITSDQKAPHKSGTESFAQKSNSLDPVTWVWEKAKKSFKDAKGSHGWDHTLRVIRLCEHIGPIENADMTVLLIAASLHDIGRYHQDRSNGQICHAEKGAVMAKSIIQDLPLSDKQKSNIIHAIKTHRFRGENAPETTEAKVLFDADKLDAIGAVGIARAYLFAGELGARLHNPDNNIKNTKSYSKDDTGYREFKKKLCKIKDRVLTAEGYEMAKKRHKFMVNFFDRFMKEYKGNI